MSKMPPQRPGLSRQDFGTPKEFIRAVERRYGKLDLDLAAHEGNHITPAYYGHGGLVPDSLAVEWPLHGNLWLNCEFGSIEPWAKKCHLSSSRPENQSFIYLLVPASIGSNWFAKWVYNKAWVIALQGRLSFDGKAPYPKDCMLCFYNGKDTGFEVWDWRKDA